MVDYKKILTETNPVFVLFLGATPAVALSTDIKAALGVGKNFLKINHCFPLRSR